MNTKFEHYQELYKVSVSTGKMQVWFGWVDFDEVCCSYGQLEGKKQTQKYQATPKNEGRANATTRFEQAEIELQAMYKAQCENKHYRTTQEGAIEFVDSNKEPRKVTNYKDRHDKMSQVLLTSIKQDGSRACVLGGQLYSKIGKPEDIKVEHLRLAVETLKELATFDAEVYADGLSLQRIRSAWLKPVKTDKELIKVAKERAKKKGVVFTSRCPIEAVEFLGYNPNEDAPKLKFHIFDIPDTTGKPFTERVTMMEDFDTLLNNLGLSDSFEFLYPLITQSHEERMDMLAVVCGEGREGLCHYEPSGTYEFGKRSTNTAKSKPRLDAECRVVSVTKDKNGEGLLHVVGSDTLDNCKFKLKMKVVRRDGLRYERDYESMLELVGKWITFSYEALSDSGNPQKGVGECERDCDEEGNPLN